MRYAILLLCLLTPYIKADVRPDLCRTTSDCYYSDELCIFEGPSKGTWGECTRMGVDEADNEVEPPVQVDETGPEYKHGDWCIDGRVF